MGYRFVTSGRSYADLASGSVLHSASGHPAFPVRLASEMFLRGLAALGPNEPVTIWDPCCGSGYLLTVLAFLHRRAVNEVIASDINGDPVALARQNLTLLTQAGLSARAADLAELAERYGKSSHEESVAATGRLARQLTRDGGDVPSVAQVADAFDPAQLAAVLDGRTPHLVITDVPYGEQTEWHGANAESGTAGMVRAVASVLPADAMIVVAARGRRVPLGDGIRPTQKFKIGTRAVALLQAGQLQTSPVHRRS
ncbi:rRNA methyltransferase [Dactylosporangium sp. NPDC000555]|uniref:rRNA methyltransferase n=1 Tax=Dactylosporangium sp. NPDC000555 TaxID=3154260 RepID=UPI00332F93D8